VSGDLGRVTRPAGPEATRRGAEHHSGGGLQSVIIPRMRPLIIAANWKMNTTPADAGELAATIAARTEDPAVIRVICPPYVCLAAVRDALAGKNVGVGAQNVHHELAGAYTGEISAAQLNGLATWVILGHSERRRDQLESDALIGKKLARAISSGLRPILCVGELLDEREAGKAVEVVANQLRGALEGKDIEALLNGGFVIAYEPVWAIGTGRTASAADAAAMAEAIRATLSADLGWGKSAESVPVLYGGSVTSANIAEFLAEHSIDGGLVGGASLKPDEMAGMVASAAVVARARAAAEGKRA
jgi:triosephosphate isomerase